MASPSPTARRRIAAGVAFTFVVGAGLAAVVLSWRTEHEPSGAAAFAIGHTALAAVGALIVVYSERRRIGWLLVAIAVSGSLHVAANHLAVYALLRDGTTWVARTSAAVQGAAFGPVLVGAILLALTFPEGRILSKRWRPVVWIAVVFGSIAAIGGIVDAVESNDLLLMTRDASLRRGNDPSANAIDLAFALCASMLLLVAGAAMVVRLVRTRGAERDQIKWAVIAILILALHWPVGEIINDPNVFQVLPGIVAVVVAGTFAIAIFRYRLWDVDLVVRRSLVYGVLWVAIAAVYLAVAAGLGLAAGSRFPIAVAIGLTLAATIAFEPLRRRLESVANRRVFGRHADPVETIGDLGEVVSQADDPDGIGRHLAEAAMNAANPAWVRVRLAGAAEVQAGRQSRESFTSIPIAGNGTTFGELTCQPKAGEEFDEGTLATFGVLATLAALGISHTRLAARIANAAADERRKVERDLHDGAQQDLVALIARLGLERSNGDAGHELFASLQDDVRRILRDLRSLAQGIHPSVLTDGGLSEAVRDCADRFPLPIAVDAAPDVATRRFDADIEATMYFLVAEALTNVVKHAEATCATVRLDCHEMWLRAEVSDDGNGFDPTDSRRRGLAGMADRVAAHGGSVRITSRNGAGTTVTVLLPCTPAPVP